MLNQADAIAFRPAHGDFQAAAKIALDKGAIRECLAKRFDNSRVVVFVRFRLFGFRSLPFGHAPTSPRLPPSPTSK